MVIVMRSGATEQEIDHVLERLQEIGAEGHVSRGEFRTVIGAIGDDREIVANITLEAIPGVERVIPILKPYKLVSREFRDVDTVLNIGDAKIGEGYFSVMAGPCSVETEEQMLSAAKLIKDEGGAVLRGGAFKPRTSPYSFQGLGKEGLQILGKVSKATGLPIVTEVLDVRDVELVAEHADILQIGARNMQNFLLLTEVGRAGKPILLKRGFSCTIEEILLAAEYIAKSGNDKVIMCERGIRTFEDYTRNTLDISAVPALKHESHLPVVVDPSHSSGRRELIEPLCLAALAAGADGVVVEMHPKPEDAWCDGPQSLTFDSFSKLMTRLRSLAPAFEKRMKAKAT